MKSMYNTLIVEDSDTFRKTLEDALSRRFPDMGIESATDGTQALEKITRIKPDMVIMDIRLPGENGLSLTGKIKKRWPEMTVIILTEYDLPEYRAAAFENGADKFIPKGALNLSEIEEMIHP
jgi:DNA-binding NarL/FixJ family response regulator